MTDSELFYKTYEQQAQQAARGTKIFPKVILAAAALESAYGKSALTKQANNFFGVKVPGNYTGSKVAFKTREVDKNGKDYYVLANFKKYPSAKASFQDYIKLVSSDRYKKAGVLAAKNEAEQVAAIKAANYATDPLYVQKLNLLISKIKLNPVKTGLGLLGIGLGIATTIYILNK